MKRTKKVRSIFSGMMALALLLSAVMTPFCSYASEPETEKQLPPAYEEVKDLIAEDEAVKASDYEMEVGYNFDVKSDFSGIEIPDNLKVKVTF